MGENPTPNESDDCRHCVHGWTAIFNPTCLLFFCSPMAQSEGCAIRVTAGKETASIRGGRGRKEKRKR